MIDRPRWFADRGWMDKSRRLGDPCCRELPGYRDLQVAGGSEHVAGSSGVISRALPMAEPWAGPSIVPDSHTRSVIRG